MPVSLALIRRTRQLIGTVAITEERGVPGQQRMDGLGPDGPLQLADDLLVMQRCGALPEQRNDSLAVAAVAITLCAEAPHSVATSVLEAVVTGPGEYAEHVPARHGREPLRPHPGERLGHLAE